MSCTMNDKICCDGGGKVGAGCYHDHCTGPVVPSKNNNHPEDSYFNFLDDIPKDADNYEVEKFDDDEDEGCEGGACKI